MLIIANKQTAMVDHTKTQIQAMKMLEEAGIYVLTVNSSISSGSLASELLTIA